MEYIIVGIILFGVFYLMDADAERQRQHRERELEITRRIALREANKNLK